MLLDYVNFLEAYGNALYNVIYSETLRYDVKYFGNALGKPKKIFKQGHIVGILAKETSIHVGDLLVAETNNKILPFISGEIEELQVDNEKLTEVSPGKDVGIKVPFKGKSNFFYFIIPREHRIDISNSTA